MRTKPLEFFCQPIKFGCPITAKSFAAIVVRQAQRLRRLGRAAAARSTRLRPIHFIHFIEAALYRGPNLPEGIRNHYNSVMIGKEKVFGEKLTFALHVLRSSPGGLRSFNDSNVIVNLWTVLLLGRSVINYENDESSPRDSNLRRVYFECVR